MYIIIESILFTEGTKNDIVSIISLLLDEILK